MAAEQLVFDFSAAGEEWRPIEGWPDYEVSSFGRVRRCRDALWTNPKNGQVYPRQRAGTILMPNVKKRTGYPRVLLHNPGGHRKEKLVHILVCATFHGPRPSPKHEVAHGDGNRTNNRHDNLRWATHKENGQDMSDHGRTNRGTKAHRGKLNEEQVRELRRRATQGESINALARAFRIRHCSASRIIKRMTWGWLSDEATV